MLQSGFGAAALYENIAAILSQKGLYRFIGVGPQIASHAGAFEKISNRVFFQSTEELLQHLATLQLQDETILLKGARVFRFEQISHVLEQKKHFSSLCGPESHQPPSLPLSLQ